MSPPPETTTTLPLRGTKPAHKYIYNHTLENIHALVQEVTRASPSITHTFDAKICTAKAHTKHSTASPSEIPTAVLYPASTSDVSVVLKSCYERHVAVTSFSGGTSLGGALRAHEGGICVSFEQMTVVGEVHEGDMDVCVEAGVGWVELNKELEEKGLMFPVDPAPGARIGGMIAMSCSGTNAYRYGTMADRVLSLTCVLADGTIIKTRGGNRPRKSSAGYDLTHLIIGSEGTLALTTEAILKLSPLPKNLHVALATFDTMQHGVDAVMSILKTGHQLEAIELLDAACIHAINHSKIAATQFHEQPTLFLKFAGLSPVVVEEQITSVNDICTANSLQTWEVSSEKQRIDALWGARKSLGHAFVTLKQKPTDLFLNTDCAVPISKLAVFCARTDELVKAEGSDWFCASMMHGGDGNVHTAIVCPEEASELVGKMMHRIQRLALELEGTVTGEHGVGVKLMDVLVEEVGMEGVDVMRKVKRALDPRGILGPGKVFRLEAEDDG